MRKKMKDCCEINKKENYIITRMWTVKSKGRRKSKTHKKEHRPVKCEGTEVSRSNFFSFSKWLKKKGLKPYNVSEAKMH